MQRRVRWLVPAAVAGVIAVGALAPGASADLPPRTPQQVLELAQQGSDLEAFSGTVRVRTDLGVPTALLGGEGSDGAMAADTDRTVRIWKDGDDRQRLSMASRMGEQTLVRDGEVVWLWDSGDATATRLALPDASRDGTPPWATGEPVDPNEAARWVLDAVGPTTQVSAGEPTVVAGREAYELVLVPTQRGTLVGRVALAVDAETGAVLRLQVTATGAAEPAVDIGYTTFDPTPPPADVFAFSPPPGSTVERDDVPRPSGMKQPGDVPQPQVLGSGWRSVVVLPQGTADEVTAQLPPGVAQPVDGGAVVTTALVSVLLADDGRVLVGPVTPEVLTAAAGG